MSAGYRSLADQFRDWPDDRLTRLLLQRPDLATPAPQDSAQLASRAAVRSSLIRALDRLNRCELSVLDALIVSGQTTQSGLTGIVHAAPESVQAAVERLVDLGLAWEATGGLRPLTGIADGMVGGAAAGVSGVRAMAPTERRLADAVDRVAALSAPARALLEHLDAHGGEGRTARAGRGAAAAGGVAAEARTPVEELLARGLVTPSGEGLVVLPGEVALVLRGGRTTAEPVDRPPGVMTSPRDQALVDRAASGAAFELVRRLGVLLDTWGTQPPGVLRAGGLSVRDLKAAARLLDVEIAVAALVVEVAHAAGLLAEGVDGEGDPVWVPSDAFDLWSGKECAGQWSTLARAWLQLERVPALVGERDATGRARNALGPDLGSGLAVESRAMTLHSWAATPPGEVLADGTGVPSLVAEVSWHRPRRPSQRADQVGWTVQEATVLGLSALGGLSAYARLLIADDADGAQAALAGLLPEPVDQVLLQADLTAVAPGPLEAQVARTLHLVADVESRGGATVFRFTPGSVRRAFDHGWSAAEVHEFVAGVSRTPVPQALSYLVDDTARTFGTLRVGHAEAFLRADDESALTELLHHPQARSLGLRRLAPTVVISSTPLDVLLPRLRELGAAPVVEGVDGTVRVARPDQVRARVPRAGSRTPAAQAAREQAQVAHAVSAVRAGDRAAAARGTGAPEPATSPAHTLSALREAAELGQSVLIGYLDAHGTATERIIDPRRVEAGQVTAYDHRSDDVRGFLVHRITHVRPTTPS